MPLGRMVPRATEALAEAMVATSRIEAFLNLAEDSASRSRLTDQIKSLGSPQGRSGGGGDDEGDEGALRLRCASFRWGVAASDDDDGVGLCLRDIEAAV